MYVISYSPLLFPVVHFQIIRPEHVVTPKLDPLPSPYRPDIQTYTNYTKGGAFVGLWILCLLDFSAAVFVDLGEWSEERGIELA